MELHTPKEPRLEERLLRIPPAKAPMGLIGEPTPCPPSPGMAYALGLKVYGAYDQSGGLPNALRGA